MNQAAGQSRAAERHTPCCATGRWWTSYREVLRSLETIATLLSLAFLMAGWLTAWAGMEVSRWFYLVAAFIAGVPIVKGCVESLRERRISVEVLVATAIVAALLKGEFHAGAVVAVMLLGGGVVEQVTVARARRSLASLLVHMPQTARVRRGDTEVEVPVRELRAGDRVVVCPGERLAVDGIVVAGDSAVDESPITGESLPADKTAGANVFAGTINQSGMLEVEAQGVGEDTTLAHILRLVEEAQASQAPIQRIADAAAQWYVPAALMTAAVVWVLTGDTMRGITVLIVFCPCALVLATPTAIAASIGHAARRVILVKGGVFAEAAGQIDIVAFDKTGTLTIGQPAVTRVLSLDSLGPAEVLRYAATAERFSEHPLGQAVRRAAEQRQLALLEPSHFRAFAGRGVEAQVNGQRILVGQLSWLGEQAVALPAELRQQGAQLEANGHTVLAVASNGRSLGLIAVRDGLRPEAKEAIARLKAQGVRIAMLTGDNECVAKAIAAEAGIDEVQAGLLPEDKLRRVRQWQAEGLRVAFIGDGVNDAPALAAADIGVAMGAAGTDVALETSDIAFLSDDLKKMPEVIALSRRTLRVIRQNIAFSVVVNIAAVIGAGMGWINPVAGAVIHESGAMLVILNAVRLLR